MHLSQVQNPGSLAARGAEEVTGTGEADDKKGGTGEETVLLRVDDGGAKGGAGGGAGAA